MISATLKAALSHNNLGQGLQVKELV